MKTDVVTPTGYEFCFPELDTLVRVEVSAGAILLRATRATFSEDRKVAFIRELAYEGFIPDEYRWLAQQRLREGADLRWVIDHRWLELTPALLAKPRRFVVRLIAGATCGWVVMMAVLFLWRFA